MTRTVLVVACLVVVALVLMRLGRRNDKRRQDRVVHAGPGVRAEAEATLYPEALVIERDGAVPVLVPADDKSAYSGWVRTINGRVAA